MSRLHERLKKHEGMSLAEKIKCNCDLCKGLNLHKKYEKVTTSTTRRNEDDTKL